MAVEYDALSRGSAWLVLTKYARDSLLVHVDYPADRVRLTCPAAISVGASAQLVATVVNVAGMDWMAQPSFTWTNVANGTIGTVAQVNADGVVTGLSPGTQRITVIEGISGTRGTCDIQVGS